MANKDNIKIISKFGSAPEWELMAIDSATDPLNTAKRIRSEAKLIWSAHEEAVAAIQADPDYTKTGKMKKLQAATETATASLAKLRAGLGPVEKALTEATSQATKKATSEDRIASLLEQTEIRRYLEPDPLKVKIAYEDALEAGDFATLDAIEGSPRLWPGRPTEEVLTGLKSDRLTVVDPRLGEQVNWLNHAVRDTTDTLDYVAQDIEGSAPDKLTALAGE